MWMSPRVEDLEVPSKDARRFLLRMSASMRRRNRPAGVLREARAASERTWCTQLTSKCGRDHLIGTGVVSREVKANYRIFPQKRHRTGWPRPARTSGIFAACTIYSRLDIRIFRCRSQDKRRPKGLFANIGSLVLWAKRAAADINRKLWLELTPFKRRMISYIKEHALFAASWQSQRRNK